MSGASPSSSGLIRQGVVPAHQHPEPAPPPVITLTTDIGWAYAAQMKAVILRRVPAARFVDIAHEVGSHRVMEGAFLMRYCAPHFPPGSIHVGIVDPGVGGPRQPLAIACADGSTLVGPDNGLLSPLAEALGGPRAYRLRPETVADGQRVSATFEGRDLFAPAAALLASGIPADALGDPTTAMEFRLPEPNVDPGGGEVAVLHIDPFGNIITNLTAEKFESSVATRGEQVTLHVGDRHFRAPVVRAYTDLAEGALGVLISSFGLVEVAVHLGRADKVLGARVGTRIVLASTRGRG